MQALANGHADKPQTTRLHVGHLTRNVNEGHIKEIFSTFGTLKSVELSYDKARPFLICLSPCLAVFQLAVTLQAGRSVVNMQIVYIPMNTYLSNMRKR